MLLTGKLAGAAQLGIGRHRRRAVPMARLTAGRGPARRSGGRRGTTTGQEVHWPGAGLGQGWTTTQPERPDRRSGGPGAAAGGTGAGGRTRMAGALESHG